MSLKLNLNLKSSLKKQIEEEATKSNKVDTRFLNYYDLKDGEKVKILLIPDVNGQAWAKFRKHGPNLKIPGVGGVRCSYESSGVDCPACQKGFELLEIAKQTQDESYKTEAKRWFARDYTLMSCLVLDSPFEVQESPDGNQVKLLWLPYNVETLIKENISEGVIDESELFLTPLFIKKNSNGKFAGYKNSYFDRRQVSDDELAFFEDLKVEQYDYSTLDAIPEATTEHEVEEWLNKAIVADQKAKSGGDDKEESPRKPAAVRQEEQEKEQPRRQSILTQRNDDIDEDEKHMGEDRSEDMEPVKPKPVGGLRERLSNLR